MSATETARGVATHVEPGRAQQTAARRAAEVSATVPSATYQRPFSSGGPGLLDRAVVALGQVLREHGHANAAYRDARFERYSRVNVAVGVTDPDGAQVPVTIFDADTKDAATVATERQALAARAAAGELTAPESAGATCSIIDLSPFGVTAFTPLLTAPHAVALGLGDGVLSLTTDLRALSPAESAALLAAIAAQLDDVARA